MFLGTAARGLFGMCAKELDDEGFEPSTFRMQNGRSTTELNAHNQIFHAAWCARIQWDCAKLYGAPSKISPAGNRTRVTRVTGGYTNLYTTEDCAIIPKEKVSPLLDSNQGHSIYSRAC